MTSNARAAPEQRSNLPGRLSIFNDGSYRSLWGIGAINSVMRWIEMVAVSVYVLDLTGSVWALTLVTFFRSLPMFTFGVFFGAIADKVDRRKLLIAVMVLMALTYAALGVLVVTHRIQLWHVYTGAFLVGVGWATDFPVRRNIVSDVVGRSRIAAAIGSDQATMNVSRIAGPTLSGVLVQVIGVQAAYFCGALLYSAAIVLAIKLAWRPVMRTLRASNPLSNIAEGMRYLRKNNIIMPTLIITVIVNLFAFPYTAVVPAIARDEMHIGAVLLGVLTSFEGLGATLGSILIATRSTPRSYTRIYFFGSCLFSLMVILFSQADWFGAALPMILLAGLGMSGFGAMQSIIILNAVPTEMRGRVLGVLTVCIGSAPLGALLIGWLSEALSPQTGVAIIGACALAGVVATALAYPGFVRAREIEPEAPVQPKLKPAEEAGA